jgi:hypothetical protein
MEFLKPYASKILLGIRARVEVFKLSNKKEYTASSRQQINRGFVTSFDQVDFFFTDFVEILLIYSGVQTNKRG